MIALALLTFASPLASPLAQAASLPDFAEPARTGQHNPKDAAVVIGVEDYFDVPDVPFARADAQAFDDFIRYTRGVSDDRVTRLLDARAGDIRRAVQDQGKRVGPGGTLWVYFAGHGAMDPTAERRLLLGRDASTDPTQFADFAVAVDDVRTWATSGGGDVMLVVDACYNGGGRTGEGVLTGGRRLVVPNYALQSGNRATEWAATAPQELSAPLSAVSHGAFTYFAVGALRGWADGEVDGTRDGNVTAEEANKYVARSLRAVQTQGQTPQLSTTDASKLVLARGVKELGPGREDLALLRGGSAVAVVTAPVGAPVVVPRTGDAVVQTDGKDLDFAELARQAQLQDQAAAAARDAAEQAAAAARDAAAKAAADEQRRAAAAAKLQAEKDAAAQALKDELARRLAAERKQKMDAAAEELQAAASRDYAAISALVASPSNAGQPVLEAWLARYGTAKVSVDGVSQAVVVVEADKVRAALQKLGAVSKSLGTMKWIPAGTFLMGSPSSESDRSSDETQHSVTLSKGYWLMEHEVTQGEWQAVMGSNPSYFTACGPTCPVERVSWNDAVAFAQKASALDGVTYTLPTEAQWEYAARGGQATSQQTMYAGWFDATSVGWISDNSSSSTNAACGLDRNGYGLCDMTGNVWEWTSDGYGDYGGSATDPTGASGSSRVYRGGGWSGSAQYARVANRGRDDPTYRSNYLGFRLSRTGP
jgi:formylglycine-generating enzyme required for sulfatase activity